MLASCLTRAGPLRMLSTYTDSTPLTVTHDSVEVISSDGKIVRLTRATASLSDAPMYPSAPCVHAAAPAQTLVDLVAVADALVSRFFTSRPTTASLSALEKLRRLSLPRRMAVLRASQLLEFRSVARMATIAISEVLRGKSCQVLQIILEAEDDLTPQERAQALAEPLFTPPTAEDEVEVDTADGLVRSDADCWGACLADLDARSLRNLKAVSRLWRARARRVLGDACSAWRANPEWSAGTWAVDWFVPRLSSDDETMRKRALLALDSLEATVELPYFVPDLMQCLHAQSRSSARALALRALSRMESLTLELVGDALRDALEHNLEPHEIASERTRTLMTKLGMRLPATSDPGATGAATCAASATEADLGDVGEPRLEMAARAAKKRAHHNEDPLSPDDLRRKLMRGACTNCTSREVSGGAGAH